MAHIEVRERRSRTVTGTSVLVLETDPDRLWLEVTDCEHSPKIGLTPSQAIRLAGRLLTWAKAV